MCSHVRGMARQLHTSQCQDPDETTWMVLQKLLLVFGMRYTKLISLLNFLHWYNYFFAIINIISAIIYYIICTGSIPMLSMGKLDHLSSNVLYLVKQCQYQHSEYELQPEHLSLCHYCGSTLNRTYWKKFKKSVWQLTSELVISILEYYSRWWIFLPMSFVLAIL